LLAGSRQGHDTLILRALLEGLNTQGRQWNETIVICDDGSLEGLEHEVSDFKYLEHQRVKDWPEPNIVICFMDRLSHNRASERLLSVAATKGVPAFLVTNYDS